MASHKELTVFNVSLQASCWAETPFYNQKAINFRFKRKLKTMEEMQSGFFLHFYYFTVLLYNVRVTYYVFISRGMSIINNSTVKITYLTWNSIFKKLCHTFAVTK